jgi:hypothetical protein
MYVDYDTFTSLSPLRKNRTLQQLTPENKSELVKTHLQHFLDENHSRLNDEQVRFVEKSIAFVAPELFERIPSKDDFTRDREIEATLLRLFSREDARKLHFGAFKNSGEIPNPVARAIAYARARNPTDELEAALLDLANTPSEELRARRPELATLLGHHYDGVPAGEEFWTQISDEDVRLAALRARSLVHKVRNPIALTLFGNVPRVSKSEVDDLASALRDLANLPIDKVRATRPTIAALLARYFDGLPAGEEFWRLAEDKDVRIAASRAYVFVTQPWLRDVAPPQPNQQC